MNKPLPVSWKQASGAGWYSCLRRVVEEPERTGEILREQKNRCGRTARQIRLAGFSGNRVAHTLPPND